MAKQPKQPKQKDPLTRAIQAKERAIASAKNRQAKARSWAEEECTRIQKDIARNQVLLDALKRGSLKP